jgi:hypothetical protein
MKLGKLIAKLLELQYKHGESIEVRVEAERSQTTISASWVGYVFVEDSSLHMTEKLHENDVDDDSDEVILIQGI